MTKMVYHSNQDLDNYIQQMQSYGKEPTTNKEFKWTDEYHSIYDTQRICRRDFGNLRNWKEYRDTQYKTVDMG